MSQYEWLDHLADSVNPILGVLALGLPWLARYRSQRSGWLRVFLTLASVSMAYVLQVLDHAFQLWSRATLDYSTHSAVCAALLVSLAQLKGAWRLVSVLIGLGYAVLMLYQRYHTPADILTSGALIGGLAALIWWSATRDRSLAG